MCILTFYRLCIFILLTVIFWRFSPTGLVGSVLASQVLAAAVVHWLHCTHRYLNWRGSLVSPPLQYTPLLSTVHYCTLLYITYEYNPILPRHMMGLTAIKTLRYLITINRKTPQRVRLPGRTCPATSLNEWLILGKEIWNRNCTTGQIVLVGRKLLDWVGWILLHITTISH